MLLIVIFLVSPQLKLLNSNATYFDLQIYVNKIKNYNFLFELNKNHFEPFLYLFSLVNKVFSDLSLGQILILFQSFFLLMPIIFFKSIKLKIFYLINPLIWNLNLFDFHPESILFLITFIIVINMNRNIFLLVLLTSCLLLIKEVSIIIIPSLILLILQFKNIKYLKVNFLYFLSFVYSLMILIFFNMEIVKIEKNFLNFVFSFKYLLFILIQIIFLFLLNKFNRKNLLILYCIPVNLIFLLFAKYSQISIFSHHYFYLISPLIIYGILEKSIFIFYFMFIYTLTLSGFPLSLVSLTNSFSTFSIYNYLPDNESNEYRNFLINRFDYLNEYKIIIDNNAINDITTKFDNINPYPVINNFDESEDTFKELVNGNDMLYIIKKNDFYFDIDKKLKNLNDKRIFLLNKTKKIIFENDRYLIFRIYI